MKTVSLANCALWTAISNFGLTEQVFKNRKPTSDADFAGARNALLGLLAEAQYDGTQRSMRGADDFAEKAATHEISFWEKTLRKQIAAHNAGYRSGLLVSLKPFPGIEVLLQEGIIPEPLHKATVALFLMHRILTTESVGDATKTWLSTKEWMSDFASTPMAQRKKKK